MSSRRLWVRISNCSRDVLSTWGERSTVQRLIMVGSSTGPVTRAPVRRTVSTISFIERSRRLWSYALSRMRIFWSALTVTMPLLRDLRDDAGAHGAPALADREPQLLLHRHRLDQLDRHRHVVPRHHHLHPRRQRAHPRHVRRPEVELRPVPVEKRRVPPAFVFAQDVDFRLELLVPLDRPRLRQHLPTLHFIFVNASKQRADVIAGPPLIEELPEHLHPRHHRLLHRLLHPHDLDLFPYLHNPPLHPTRHHRPPPRDRENVLDRHQERLVHHPHRRRDVAVHRL